MIRLFAADLDGTLLNEDSQLDKETIEAIRAFQEQGGTFMVATGRNSWEVEQITDNFPDTVYNCVNGSLLCDSKGREIVSYALDKETADVFESFIRERGCAVLYHGEKSRHCNLSMEELRNTVVGYLVAQKNYLPERAQDFFRYMFEDGKTVYSSSLKNLASERILKLEIFFISEDRYRDLIETCRHVFHGCNVTNGSFFNNIEITSPDSGKGKLIREYCRISGIGEDETAVIGDGGNDLEMLSGFRNSYAMGNAPKEVKEAAAHVADDNRHHGAAKVIREICRRNREEANA